MVAVKIVTETVYKLNGIFSLYGISRLENPVRMRLLIVFLLIALIVLPAQGWRRRRRRRWLPIRGGKVLTGAAVAARLGLIGKRGLSEELTSADVNQDGLIDQSEAENLFDKRDVDKLLELADNDGDSVITKEEFERGMNELFSEDAE